jgi:hypothetical protein
VVAGVYADLASSPFAAVPGLPAGERPWVPPAVWGLHEDLRRARLDWERTQLRQAEDRRRQQESFTFWVEPEAGETEQDALIRKVQMLVDRGATEGERSAARAALGRLRAAR